MHTLSRLAHRDDLLEAAIEADHVWRHLNDIGSAIFDEQFGASKVVQERLTIIAVADGPISLLPRYSPFPTMKLTTTTPEFQVFAHAFAGTTVELGSLA